MHANSRKMRFVARSKGDPTRQLSVRWRGRRPCLPCVPSRAFPRCSRNSPNPHAPCLGWLKKTGEALAPTKIARQRQRGRWLNRVWGAEYDGHRPSVLVRAWTGRLQQWVSTRTAGGFAYSCHKIFVPPIFARCRTTKVSRRRTGKKTGANRRVPGRLRRARSRDNLVVGRSHSTRECVLVRSRSRCSLRNMRARCAQPALEE